VVILVKDIIKSIRPRQWIKNLSLYAALIFSGQLFVDEKLWLTTEAVVVFCILTSAVYLFNDVIDRESDRMHPFKRLRPIAAGKVSVELALALSGLGVVMALGLGRWLLGSFFLLVLLGYIGLQLTYSSWLKHVAVVEVMIVAVGFILRVYAGALAIEAHLSVWFLLCVVSVALFLAVGKRRAELAILTERSAAKHRKVLSRYPPEVLNTYVAMFANSAWLSWAMFTFFEPPPPIVQTYPTLFAQLPLTLAGTNKWLMLTIPVVIYGIMRYVRIIYDGSWAESPERVLLSDKPLLAGVGIWGLMVVGIIYFLPGKVG
jgi:4-hydroxybenzoate polyprenyltransferase